MAALPASMQVKKDNLVQLETPNTPAKPELPPADTANTQVPPSNEGSVTITREEFNDMQAKADRVKAAEGKADIVKGELEVLQARLTELEKGRKATPEPVAPSAPASSSAARIDKVAYTDKELEDYGASEKYIAKVVLNTLVDILPTILADVGEVKGEINKLKESVSSTNERFSRQTQKSFLDKVKDKVKDFDEIIQHKNWRDFGESMEPVSGLTYQEILALNHNREDLDKVANVFTTFKTKYGIGAKNTSSGYEGASPSGTSPAPTTTTNNKRLKMSDRKKLQKDYITGKIAYPDYETAKKEFEQAEVDGRLDYDN